MKVLFDNAEYDGQLLRALGYTYYGGADVGECLTTARRIKEGDDDSWYTEWMATADRLVAAAEASRAAGHAVSSREAYLRASNYYRTAYIFLYRRPVDPRTIPLSPHVAIVLELGGYFPPTRRYAFPPGL